MGAGSTAKRRRTGTDSSANSGTPSRAKSAGTGRGRGRPPNAPRDGRERPPPIGECFRKRCGDVLDRLSKKDHYNIFLEPVNTDDVAGYAETIKRPMDFTTMRTKLANQAYRSLGEFRRDLDLIWSNCLLFNGKEPTNIFSKKAIELRRLTEKLIATTRQNLEKDKENILKWREKHKRRKETMQANAAISAHGLHGPNPAVASAFGGRDPRPHATVPGRDPMDTSTHGFPTEDNGRTPEQNALAESLRLQYAGTTGLYKKSMVNAPIPQYTNPDGSVVQIPVRRYQPHHDHWEDGHAGRVPMLRVDACPTLLCESLPMSSTANPCAPQPRTDSVLVKNYADSLYRFVKDTGPIASQIVTELLSPELTVKNQQEEILKKGFSLKDLANKAKVASQRAASGQISSGKNWDAEAIIHLADDIERANRRVVSILPKLPRPIPELDGIGGLERLLGKELVKEVDAVPVQIVDYAMPHGVSLSTMNEIARLQNAPALGISQKDLQCIESLRKHAQDYAQRIGPEAAANMSGASILTPGQLHEIQLRALLIRQQRRLEAQRQATLIEQRRHFATGEQPNDLAVLQKREQDLSAQNQQRSRVPDLRPATRPPHQAASHPIAQSRAADTVQKARLAHQAAVAAVKAASLGIHDRNIGQRAAAHQGVTQGQRVINALPPADKNSVCKNCGTRDTFGWRAGGIGPDGVERLCIPCGLYWEKTNHHRPKDLWGQSSQRKSRIPSSSSTPNGLSASRGGMTIQQTLAPSATPNGITNRPIQKMTKLPQSSQKRSPSSGGSRGKITKSRVPVATSAFAQGARPIQAAQQISSLPSSFAGATPQSAPTQMHNAAQLFTNQRTNVAARNIIAPQTMQPVHSMHGARSGVFPGSAHSGVNSGVSANVNVQQQLQAGMNQMMYAGQQPVSGVMTSQHLMGMGSQGQAANLVAIQNNPLVRQKMMGQQLGAPQIGMSNGVNAFVPQMQQPKNASMLMNTNGNVGQNIAPNPQISMFQQTGMPKNVSQLNNGNVRLHGAQQGHQVNVPDGSAIPGGLGISGLPPFMNQGGLSSAMVSNFGDVGSRAPFSNSPGVGGDAVAPDQIGDMFFTDGAIETPTGAPDFAF